ncbi:PilX N-terminal domain-containing pilus assembly protein [Aeromonas caviae]
MKRQSGFTTFTVTLLLILILIGISLLVGKLMVADRKVSVNEVQYRQALALAELGIADGMGRLAAAGATVPSGGLSIPGSSAQGTYLLTAASAATVTVGTGPDTLDVTPVLLRAEATLADELGKATVQVQVAGYNLMADAKAVPLMGLGISIGGSYNIVANPNGGGPGVPLSVWSEEPVTGNGAWKTCHLGDFSGGCGVTLSDSKDPGPDIQDADSAFPDDLLLYLFGEPDTPSGWLNMNGKAVAAPPTSSCGSLGPTSTGIYIVEGNCVLPDDTGSANAPVVLIVKNGDLTLNAGKTFNGIIFVYSSTKPSLYDVKTNGHATINGSLILNSPPKNLNGTFDLKYDQTVMSSIQSGAMFKATKMVPGSWRDW